MLQPVRLFHTVRYLKPVQIYSRIRHRYQRPQPRLDAAPCRRNIVSKFEAPIRRRQTLIGQTRFRFLNEEGRIDRRKGWNDPTKEKLWLYNLHYFDTLAGSANDEQKRWQQALVSRWIAENPVGQGNGWEPYPLSLRIVNWIKWFLCGTAMQDTWRANLAVQVRWLEGRLEWHLLGNHLLANAKALVFAGLFFEGPEAERWLERGLSIYRTELAEQILDDGGHFERSPMYHAIILEDLLDIYNLARSFEAAETAEFRRLPELVARMLHWLAAMTHPDGDFSFFNDTACGITASRRDLEDYAARLELAAPSKPKKQVLHFADSGYIRVNEGEWSAFLDTAPIGPDYLPGHAHADTLSFEVSLGSERVIVNSGTSVYGHSAQRQVERSTAAHSTVEVDGENSSEVWGAFRVARRARVHNLQIEQSGQTIYVSADHDGYRRFGGDVVHHRSWQFKADTLLISDFISGRFSRAVARFHLGPDMKVTTRFDGCSGEIASLLGKKIRWSTSAPARLEPSEWHPEFGKTIETTMLVVDLTDGHLETSFQH